jgi:hypothetical protein
MMSKNKKALIGSLPVIWMATIIIVVVLVFFVLGSFIIEKSSGFESGRKYSMYSELDSYFSKFVKFSDLRTQVMDNKIEINQVEKEYG